MSHSELPSPKRLRLSSPTYDEQCCLSQEEIKAFDDYEKRMTQSSSSIPQPSHVSLPGSGKRKREKSIQQDPEDNGDSDVSHDKSEYESSANSLLQRATHPRRDVRTHPSNTEPNAISLFASSAELSAKEDTTAPISFTDLPAAGRSSGGFTSAALLTPQEHPATSQKDTNNDDIAHRTTTVTPAKRSGFGFASALTMASNPQFDSIPSSSPDATPEPDYSTWFEPSTVPETAMVGFQSAKDISKSMAPLECAAAGSAGCLSGFKSGRDIFLKSFQPEHEEESSSTVPLKASLPGFTSVRLLPGVSGTPADPSLSECTSGLSVFNPNSSNGTKGKARASNWTAPSAEALARAQQLMKRWEQEMDSKSTDVAQPEQGKENTQGARPSAAFEAPSRPALRSVENAFSPAQPPESPSPAGAGMGKPLAPASRMGIQSKNKVFKSPLLMRPPQKAASSMPFVAPLLNPKDRPSAKLPAAFPALLPAEASTSDPPSTPAPRAKALGLTPRRLGGMAATGKPKFSTPFKLGMRPGEPGRSQRKQSHAREKEVTITVAPMQHGSPYSIRPKKKQYIFFDLGRQVSRVSLTAAELVPQKWAADELASHGIDAKELDTITPGLALYYSFHATWDAPTSTPSEPVRLGADAALARLLELGCKLATKEWTDNHWGLILWKLAGMVCMNPEHEDNPDERRWCFEEVVKQLLYRYERELHGGTRPPLRLITTHDANPSCPMVLCVSNVLWSPAGMADDGTPIEPYPELEVTDGWYRLRAVVDAPLERAIRRGKIRVGRKIAVASARLVSERKEPAEILEAYDSMTLRLSGNSCNLAPWHARLGFVKTPFVATLDKLTSDGGNVTLMDLEVIKAYPIAYIEFIQRDGEMDREGPWCEKEEARHHRNWEIRRAVEEEKLQNELQKKITLYERYAIRAQLHAGGYRIHEWEGAPDNIADLYEALEDRENASKFIETLDRGDAAWLAEHIRTENERLEENMREEVEKQLESICPPRTVKSFRVVLMRDARWAKRQPLRTVQVTVWDVLSLTFEEGGRPGHFAPGQQFLVSNLMPSQPGAWMGVEPDAVVYLTARRDARWTPVKRPTPSPAAYSRP